MKESKESKVLNIETWFELLVFLTKWIIFVSVFIVLALNGFINLSGLWILSAWFLLAKNIEKPNELSQFIFKWFVYILGLLFLIINEY